MNRLATQVFSTVTILLHRSLAGLLIPACTCRPRMTNFTRISAWLFPIMGWGCYGMVPATTRAETSDTLISQQALEIIPEFSSLCVHLDSNSRFLTSP